MKRNFQRTIWRRGLPRWGWGLALAAWSIGWGPAYGQGFNPAELMGTGPKPFVQSQGFYRVVIPSGFSCKEEKRKVNCEGNRQARALLVIEVKDVPKTATVELVALNQETSFKKLPHFRVISKEKTVVGSKPAMVHSFSYDRLGNVQYPVGVQALYLISENKLFILHFESHLHSFKDYAKDLIELYGTFQPATLDKGGHPVLKKPFKNIGEKDIVDEKLKPYLKGRF